jgi:hypothetical protein
VNRYLLILLCCLGLVTLGQAQPDQARRLVEAMAAFMQRMGERAEADELRQRFAQGRLVFEPTQSGDNAEVQPGQDLIRFHPNILMQSTQANGQLDPRAIMSWAGSYRHELRHVNQDRLAWMGSTWQDIGGQGNRLETEAWGAGFQAYANWFYTSQSQLRQGNLSLAQRTELARQVQLLGSLLAEYRQNYNQLGYAGVRLETPVGTMTLDEVMEDIASATSGAQNLADSEQFSVTIRPPRYTAQVGERVTFSAAPRGGIPIGRDGYEYHWTAGGRDLGQGRSVTLEARQNTAVDLRVMDGRGRKAQASARLTVGQVFEVSCTPATVKVAPDQEFTVKASPRGGVPPYTYAWLSDGKPTGITSAGIRSRRKKDSLLSLEVRDAQGTLAQAHCSVQVLTPLKVSMTSRLQVPVQQRYTLTPQVTGGKPPYTYRWYRNGNLLGLSSPQGSGTAKESMAIRVEVVDAAGQTQGKTCQVVVLAATQTPQPNPPAPPPPAAARHYLMEMWVPIDPKEGYLTGEIGMGEKAEIPLKLDVTVRDGLIFDGPRQMGKVTNGVARFRYSNGGVAPMSDFEGSLGPQGGSGRLQNSFGTGRWTMKPR